MGYDTPIDSFKLNSMEIERSTHVLLHITFLCVVHLLLWVYFCDMTPAKSTTSQAEVRIKSLLIILDTKIDQVYSTEAKKCPHPGSNRGTSLAKFILIPLKG